MPHDHHNHSCADESHDHDHDHDHDTSDLGPQDNLYNHVDRGVVRALNASNGEGPEVIKPWHERMDETKVRYIPQTCLYGMFIANAAVPRVRRGRPDVSAHLACFAARQS